MLFQNSSSRFGRYSSSDVPSSDSSSRNRPVSYSEHSRSTTNLDEYKKVTLVLPRKKRGLSDFVKKEGSWELKSRVATAPSWGMFPIVFLDRHSYLGQFSMC